MSKGKVILNPLSLNPSSITRRLAFIAFLLIIASVGGHLITYYTGHPYFFGLIPLFNVEHEQSFPTFFSAFLLLSASLLLLVIRILEKNRKSPGTSMWAVLSFIFLFMTADEVLSFHELLGNIPYRLLGDNPFGIHYNLWIMPGVVIVLIVAAFFMKFFLQLDSKTRLNFSIAAMLYVGGALGFEFIGILILQQNEANSLIYRMTANIEESLEMAGAIFFIRGLLIYISDNFKQTQFQLTIQFGEQNKTRIPHESSHLRPAMTEVSVGPKANKQVCDPALENHESQVNQLHKVMS